MTHIAKKKNNRIKKKGQRSFNGSTDTVSSKVVLGEMLSFAVFVFFGLECLCSWEEDRGVGFFRLLLLITVQTLLL